MKKYIVMAALRLDGFDYSHEEYTGQRYTADQWDDALDELEEAENDPCVTDAYIKTLEF